MMLESWLSTTIHHDPETSPWPPHDLRPLTPTLVLKREAPEMGSVWANRAQCWLKLGDHEKAAAKGSSGGTNGVGGLFG